LVSCPPKTANTRKRYLFIKQLGNGNRALFLPLWVLFYLPFMFPPTHHPKSHYPFGLDNMTCYHFRPKKTIWDGKLYGTLAPQGQWLSGPSSVAQRSSLSTGWVGYPLVFCHLALGGCSTSLAWSLVSSVSYNGFLFLPSLPTNPKRGRKSTFSRWRLCFVFHNLA
jgi:hypothetical protein